MVDRRNRERLKRSIIAGLAVRAKVTRRPSTLVEFGEEWALVSPLAPDLTTQFRGGTLRGAPLVEDLLRRGEPA